MFTSTAEVLGVVWSGFEALASPIFDFGLLQLAAKGPRGRDQSVLLGQLQLKQCFSTKTGAGNRFPMPVLLKAVISVLKTDDS